MLIWTPSRTARRRPGLSSPRPSQRIAGELEVVGLARRLARRGHDVAEIEVQVIIGERALIAERPRPDGGDHLARDRRVAPDHLRRVEVRVTDAIDVRRGATAVR